MLAIVVAVIQFMVVPFCYSSYGFQLYFTIIGIKSSGERFNYKERSNDQIYWYFGRTTEGLQPVVSMEPEDEMHVIFSTDCSFFQDWQTLLVFHSAVRVGQKGRITRIASGCEDIKQTELKSLYAKLFPQYSVHFTPDYKKDGKTKKKYDFYNKPYGVQHWLQNAQPPIKSGVVVALIDPDFIFLRPLVTQIAGHPSNLYITGFDSTKDPVPIKVGRGIPVSQKYGLGAPWAIDTHPDFDRRAACGAGSPCLNVTQSFGTDHYRYHLIYSITEIVQVLST